MPQVKSFDEIVVYFKSILEKFPDKRTGKNKQYAISDVALNVGWKVENENNNTLKTKGYHLEHNFGHGQKHL